MGLDINLPKGTPLFAPIDFDDHCIFSDVRRWANGDMWGLQSHHVDRLLADEHTRINGKTIDEPALSLHAPQGDADSRRPPHSRARASRLGGKEV